MVFVCFELHKYDILFVIVWCISTISALNIICIIAQTVFCYFLRNGERGIVAVVRLGVFVLLCNLFWLCYKCKLSLVYFVFVWCCVFEKI